MFEVIASIQVGTLPNAWRERTVRSVDYHAGCTGAGGNFIHYDSSSRLNIDTRTPKSQAGEIGVMQADLPIGLVYV